MCTIRVGNPIALITGDKVCRIVALTWKQEHSKLGLDYLIQRPRFQAHK